MDRTTAVNSLRKHRVFRDVSLRLLSDLIELWQQRPHARRRFQELPAAYLLVQLAQASFSLFWSLRRRGRRTQAVAGPMVHLIWVSKREGLAAPLEAMTHLLAAATASQFSEHAAVVTFSNGAPQLEAWEPETQRFKKVSWGSGASRVDPYHGIKSLNARWNITPARKPRKKGGAVAAPPSDVYHLFFVEPEDPADLPAGFERQLCHRVIYVTDALPGVVPLEQLRHLRRAVRARQGGDPYFSSFIPTLVVPSKSDNANQPAAAKTFTREPVVDEFKPSPVEPGWRLKRDQCRLRLELDALERQWGEVTRATFAAATLSDELIHACMDHWARAVTNRQVGIALSGGGASSYRMVPFLRGLHRKRVPVDVVSGVSGGALLGAFYCKDGLHGLDRFVDSGFGFSLGVVGGTLSATLVEQTVERYLGPARIEDCQIRFVPLATELSDPPQASVALSGSLAEGVMVSGAAPLIFAPTEKDGRCFTDGAFGTPVPARVLKDYGADLVFACNCVPGPRRGSLFGDVPLYRLATQLPVVGGWIAQPPLLGRLSDLWVSAAFLLQQISREAGEDAHVYIEPLNVDTPLRESFQFYDAAKIIRNSRRELKRQQAIPRCDARWRRFSRLSIHDS